MTFSLTKKTNSKIPKIKWPKIKNKILGKKYDLSLVLANNKLIEKLNGVYRKKNKPTTILSFPLSVNDGEIFLSLSCAKYEAAKFEIDFKKYLEKLFIHGLLHLKGLIHGNEMDKEENKFSKIKF